MKAIPQLFGLQVALHRLEIIAIAGANNFGCLLHWFRCQAFLTVLSTRGLWGCGAASLAACGACVQLRISAGAAVVVVIVVVAVATLDVRHTIVVVVIVVVVMVTVMMMMMMMVIEATRLRWRLLSIAAVNDINVNFILNRNGT